MTNLPDLPRDELATAYVDDMLDASTRAAVERDPGLMTAVEAHRAVRSALAAAPVPRADAARRTDALVAALAAFDAEAAPSRQSAPVVSLRARRERVWFGGRRPWIALAGGAVAAGLLVGLGITALVARDNGAGPTDAALSTVAEDAVPSTAAGEGGASTEQSARDGAAPEAATSAGAALPDLGAVGDAAGLRDRLAAVSFAQPVPPAATIAPANGADTPMLASSPCPAPEGVGVLGVFTATWQGTPAFVIVVDRTPAAAVVVSQDTCSVLAEVPLT
jgi:hypothetical protein